MNEAIAPLKPDTGQSWDTFISGLKQDALQADPLLDCLVELARIYGRPAGRAGLVAGLPISGGKLTPSTPAVLEWDNGEGLLFRRTIAVDASQMFTVSDAVDNKGGQPVQLSPYALISRHGTPLVAGYYILHEGLIGVVGADGLQE